MAGAVAAERFWRASSPERVEADLAALWRELARDAPIARALMSNLVVFQSCPRGEARDLTESPDGVPLDEVAARHPSRILLLHHDPRETGASEPLAAQIGVLTRGPADARWGVELVAIQCACGGDSLASITRALTLGDVPTSIWWAEDFSDLGVLTPLIVESRQLLYDSRRWTDVRGAVAAMTPILRAQFAPDLADLNWRRLTPVRHAILHAVGSHVQSERPPSIRVLHAEGDAALGWLLGGWWLARLADRERPNVSVEPAKLEDVLVADVTHEHVRFRLRLTARDVIVEETRGLAPFGVAVPMEGEADAVAAELSTLGHDVCLYDALSALASRFSAT